MNDTDKKFSLKLLGHSSPDGKSAKLHESLESITTAREIVEEIILEPREN